MVAHVQDAGVTGGPAPSGSVCVECEAAGGWWFRLRRCVECGHVGCCDSSLGQHARRHFEQTGHRFIRSFEPEEEWFWDFVDDENTKGIVLPPPQHHPLDQSTPGPADRVPADWQYRLQRRR
jgi:hypothetical protein